MFKEKLKELRKEANLTQEELANNLFVSRSAVAKWEQGKGFPNEKSLEDLCAFFKVTKEELYNDKDIIKTIEIVDNNSNTVNKRFLIALITSIVLFILSVICLIVIITNDKKGIEYGVMINESYLDKQHLYNIKQLDGEDKNVYNGYLYHCNISSRDEFDDYINYLYDYLKSSPYISRLSYEVTQPLSNKIFYGKHYLMNGESLNEFETLDDNYNFYYCANLDSNREEKDSVECYFISVSYGDMKFGVYDYNDGDNKITLKEYEIPTYNFSFCVYKIDEELDYLLLEEYYDVHNVYLNEENIYDYIDNSAFFTSYNKENKEYMIIYPFKEIESFRFFYNVKVKIKLTYKDSITDKEYKTKEIEKVFNLKHPNISLLFSKEDCGVDDLSLVYLYETKIIDIDVLDNSKILYCTEKN